MRRGVIEQIFDLFRKSGSSTASGTPTGGNQAGGTSTSGRRRQPKPPRAARVTPPPPSADGEVASRDIEPDTVVFEYSPCLDGDPDPGEVVWTWVPYEEDPTQGKDRPVVIIGRRGANLVGVPLTSKQHDNEPQVAVGTGPWDREGRPSYAKLERLLEVDPEQVRREGAVLSRGHFDDIVAGIQRQQSR